MEQDVREAIEREAEKHALLNAVKHEGAASVDAVLGPIMAENPPFREHGNEVPSIVADVVADVNDRSPTQRQADLEDLAPERLEELKTESENSGPLPTLPNDEECDQIRMRLAPNPNGPWHLGNARMPAVIGTYKEMYDGWMLCRFDDTDPETKRPQLEAYDAILEAISYLGFEPDEVVKASDRLETYYDHGRRLIEAGGAYTCSCEASTFSERKNAGEACPHRDKSIETTLSEFEGMISGAFESGDIVLRVRTDIEHKNPALRDWVAFRIVDTPHPRPAAAEYRCWPMLDFQSGIDDHLFDITHIIRGIDLQDSAKRQEFVYQYFDWSYPEVIHWGHVELDAYDVALSTSTIKELVEAGELDGWDDPRAPTVASLRRRGIRGEAIVAAMVELGTSTSNVELAMSSIYAENRELIDDQADRLFLVRDGIDVPIEQVPSVAEPPLHPDHETRGTRSIPVGEAVAVEPNDLPESGDRVWLKGLGPVRYDGDRFVGTDDEIDIVRNGEVEVVHWVPGADAVQVRLRRMEGDELGRAEPGITRYASDDVVQFERVGFARIDALNQEKIVAYYSHP